MLFKPWGVSTSLCSLLALSLSILVGAYCTLDVFSLISMLDCLQDAAFLEYCCFCGPLKVLLELYQTLCAEALCNLDCTPIR